MSSKATGCAGMRSRRVGGLRLRRPARRAERGNKQRERTGPEGVDQFLRGLGDFRNQVVAASGCQPRGRRCG